MSITVGYVINKYNIMTGPNMIHWRNTGSSDNSLRRDLPTQVLALCG